MSQVPPSPSAAVVSPSTATVRPQVSAVVGIPPSPSTIVQPSPSAIRPPASEAPPPPPGGKVEEDEIHFGGKRKFAKGLIDAFLPYRLLLMVFGRWPFTHHENPDGTYTYKLRWYFPGGIYFIGLSIFFAYILVGGGYTFGLILLHLTQKDNQTFNRLTNNGTEITDRAFLSRYRQGILVERHLVLMISFWTNLVFCCVTSINIFIKHKYLINYFGFWTRAVQTMHMDVAKGTGVYNMTLVGIYLGVTFLLAMMSLGRFGATPTGGPVLMAVFTFDFFNPYILSETPLDKDIEGRDGNPWILTLYRYLGGIGFLYVFVSAKVYILLYLFKCKLLRNAFAVWNGRVYAAILRGGDFTQTKEGRTTFTLLFKDHCILLDLLEGTNRFYSGVLESYFMLQVGSLCFELYIALRTLKNGDKQEQAYASGYFVRNWDFIPSFLIFCLNSGILYSLAKSAALVGEEAIAGLEVIRRKTMLGRKTDEELYFMLSMYTSYISYRKMELSAGGYFYINKEFVITIVSTIFSYFIILYQFQPILDPKIPGPDAERELVGKFLVYLENEKPCSWEPLALVENCIGVLRGEITPTTLAPILPDVMAPGPEIVPAMMVDKMIPPGMGSVNMLT